MGADYGILRALHSMEQGSNGLYAGIPTLPSSMSIENLTGQSSAVPPYPPHHGFPGYGHHPGMSPMTTSQGMYPPMHPMTSAMGMYHNAMTTAAQMHQMYNSHMTSHPGISRPQPGIPPHPGISQPLPQNPPHSQNSFFNPYTYPGPGGYTPNQRR